MLKKIASIFGRPSPSLTVLVRKGRQETALRCSPGDNLMDVTNRIVNSDANIFGLCDKQLACTTCRVDIETGQQALPPPSEEELDVLLTTSNYSQTTSRMACQITVSQQLDGLAVRIDSSGISSPNSPDKYNN